MIVKKNSIAMYEMRVHAITGRDAGTRYYQVLVVRRTMPEWGRNSGQRNLPKKKQFFFPTLISFEISMGGLLILNLG